jgi:NAD-dependent SIR2 family protein deacetylase
VTTQARESTVPEILRDGRLVVLTGAGLSTDSGIPDYRGPGARAGQPMTYQEFVSGPAARQRYWARSHLGWGRMRHASPNAGHRALAALDPELLITQNVDGLHESAGSRHLVALHGRIADVICLSCRRTSSRGVLATRMVSANPGFAARHIDAEARPDGDVDLDDTSEFVVPDCSSCGGLLKPDVVFFGESVPPDRVACCSALVEEAEALVVLGSSLHVFSGRRFVKQAHARGIPVVVVNRGPTRADALASVKFDAGCAETLTNLVAEARCQSEAARGPGIGIAPSKAGSATS